MRFGFEIFSERPEKPVFSVFSVLVFRFKDLQAENSVENSVETATSVFLLCAMDGFPAH